MWMLTFFRKIRKRLLGQGSLPKYLLYASGEILLIVVGIFMALQIQNWNERQNIEIQFRSTLEQIYTAITYESDFIVPDTMWFKTKARWADELLNSPDSLPDSTLMSHLYFLAYTNGSTYSPESPYYAQQLNYDQNNQDQKELTKEIMSYMNKIANSSYQTEPRLREELEKHGFAIPYVDITKSHGFEPFDSKYYDDIDILNFRNLVNSRSFRAILKNVRTYKHWNALDARNSFLDGQSIKALIKEYYPEVKILIHDVGIVGSALNGWDTSTPMRLVEKKSSIWEIDIYLNKGEVKFRCRDSWTQNWGATFKQDFPSGFALNDGRNIPIPEAGNYRVILNLTENTYEFAKLDEVY